jgi:hypothetical protein
VDRKKIEQLLVQALREFNAFGPRRKEKAFAPGWTEAAVLERVYDVCHFAIGNGQKVIALHRRRRIRRLASDLLSETGSGSGARAEFLGELRVLAGRQPPWRTIPRIPPGGARLATKLLSELDKLDGLNAEFIVALRERATSERQRFAILRNRGGDRRSGERSLKSSVLEMIVWLYCEAHTSPGGREGGPLFRFANAIGELALGKREPFSPGAVRGEFRRTKPRARRPPGLRALYRNTKWGEP